MHDNIHANVRISNMDLGSELQTQLYIHNMVLEPHPKAIQIFVHFQPYAEYSLPLLLKKFHVKKLCS